MPDEPDALDGGLYIDGVKITPDDLTFGEQRKMREFVRTLALDNDLDNATEADILPSLVTVWMNRTDKSFTLDQALNMKRGDLAGPKSEDPPTSGD